MGYSGHMWSAPTRRLPAGVRRQAFWLVLTVPLLLPVSWLLRESLPILFAWLPLLFLFGVLPVADWLIGRDAQELPQGDMSERLRDWVPAGAALVHFAVLLWGLSVFPAIWQSSAWAGIGWLLSLGDIGGVVAINVAHELIHRRQTWARRLGGWLLASVNYVGFKIEHLRWHHVHVATDRDPSSAAMGSNLFVFLPRALLLNTRHAWRLESERLQRQGRAFWSRHNQMLLWQGAALAVAATVAMLFGWLAVIGFFIQGLVAALTLEVINYIEHYGLRRRPDAEGRMPRPGYADSWNSNFFLSNAILLELQRHADHHVNPGRAFTELRDQPQSPQLPAGYAGMFLLALVPPLWRRVMDPRVAEYYARDTHTG